MLEEHTTPPEPPPIVEEPKGMKVIFLDIDGVLNHELFYQRTVGERKSGLVVIEGETRADYHRAQIDSEAVTFLNSLIEATGAKVVLSSTWRLGNSNEYMQELLASKGFTGELIDRTPHLGTKRGIEIADWLEKCGRSVDNYVILDDDSDMTEQQLAHHFIWVDRYCGLSPTSIYKAGRILNGESNGQFRGNY